jgi:hypothetical protein
VFNYTFSCFAQSDLEIALARECKTFLQILGRDELRYQHETELLRAWIEFHSFGDRVRMRREVHLATDALDAVEKFERLLKAHGRILTPMYAYITLILARHYHHADDSVSVTTTAITRT